MTQLIRIIHRPSNTLLAEGKKGWDITPFEGNYYIRKKCLVGQLFKLSAIPGLCPYKFIYLWLDLHPGDQPRVRYLAWKYIIPNPLLPFIWFRTGIYGSHQDIEIQKVPTAE